MIFKYLERLRSKRRLTEKTLKLYEFELNFFERFRRDKYSIDLHLRKCAPETHARKLRVWKAYLKFCNDPLLDDFEKPRIRKKQISFLTTEERKKMEVHLETLKSEDRLFLEIALRLGFRLSEILQLSCNSLQGEFVRITRKGQHEQLLPLPKELARKLQDFRGFMKCRRYYQALVPRVAKACGITKRVSPHTLRHTFATQKIGEGHNLAAVQEFLGHESLLTTARYIHASPEHLKKLVESRSK